MEKNIVSHDLSRWIITQPCPNFNGGSEFCWIQSPIRIESIKTTSMEDVSTRVLEKIKNI